VLVVNAGSSSLKLSLLDADDATLAAAELPAPRAHVDRDELSEALRSGLAEADAVGHRIVHGGEHFREVVRIEGDVKAQLRELCELAPLHQPKSLSALDAVSEALPELPAFACFDTAFHSTLPPAAATYALPERWRERFQLRRYGFHGLSHAWVSRRAPELLGRGTAGLRIVSCHLGAGASVCAIREGVSVDTTMGFTPLEGLVMATRSGSVDPGMLLWLLHHEDISSEQMAAALEHESGLLALSGSADMRDVIERAEQGNERASLALAVYLRSLRGAIAAMAASMGGVDSLVFTGGVGERSAGVRARAGEGLGFLGVAIDSSQNSAAHSDVEISAADATVATLVIAAREDREIASQVRAAQVRG
jgi:acetate kinase